MLQKNTKNYFLLLSLYISMTCYSSQPGAVATQTSDADVIPYAIERCREDGTLIHVVTNQIANNDAYQRQGMEGRNSFEMLWNAQHHAADERLLVDEILWTNSQINCFCCVCHPPHPHKLRASEEALFYTLYCPIMCPLISIFFKDWGSEYFSNCKKVYSDCDYGCFCCLGTCSCDKETD
ncbi:MAG TPA: hypothetical protein VLG50_04595, partial [Candidatus Saccharimonadales bacterium]|nr:hypothetical protein [Candidatus Saccharimonadales bacterium]